MTNKKMKMGVFYHPVCNTQIYMLTGRRRGLQAMLHLSMHLFSFIA